MKENVSGCFFSEHSVYCHPCFAVFSLAYSTLDHTGGIKLAQ